MVDTLQKLQDWRVKNNIKPAIGIETSGRQEVFGSIDEIIGVCQKVSGIIPVLNFAHIHARENGTLRKRENFQSIFDRTAEFCKGDFYTHLSGVEYSEGNEKRYTPIKKGDLKFELLAECVLDNEASVTFISSSPLLEHDAMYMRVILERVLSKKEAKRKALKVPKPVLPKKEKKVVKQKPKTKSKQIKKLKLKRKPKSAPKSKPLRKKSKKKAKGKPKINKRRRK
jgi:deoxyribonuclease-4